MTMLEQAATITVKPIFQKNRTSSEVATGLRIAVLKTDFVQHQDVVRIPKFDGYLYKEIKDKNGKIWKVPITNGYATEELEVEALTTFGADACLIGVIDSEVGEREYRTLLHSNPFLDIPIQRVSSSDKLESPFVVFVQHLPDGIQVKRIQLVFRLQSDEKSIKAAESYLRNHFPDAEIVFSQTPFDEKFDVQAANGEVNVYKAGKEEGSII